MGGRRSYSVSAVVGTDPALASEKRAVTRALRTGDPEKIATTSARLVAESERTGSFLFYGMKLLDTVRDLASKSDAISDLELDQQLRTSWAQVKRLNDIESDRALDKIVLDAAKSAVRGKKR